VTAKIQALFSDTDETRRVTLSTTHKAKGLERDRAWVLADTYRPTRGTEEANLWYVAVTRAKTTLFLVRGEEKKKDRDM
jgi:superfamily I DNA/RNA helicase